MLIFLTVTRKFKYSCVYIFHIIYPEKSISKLIISQTNIFNIFPGSAQQSNVLKILQENCTRKSAEYLPQNSNWINRSFVNLAYKYEKICFAIDCRGINSNGAGRPAILIFNVFISKRVTNNEKSEDHFVFKLNELRVGRKIITRNLTLDWN